MAVDLELEESEPTVEERLGAAEKKIASLKGDVSQLGWGLAALLASAILAVVLNGLLGDPQAKPSNHDLKVQDLLSKGAHCYDSTEERAAARQRALAAIDRIQWQQDHPEQPADPMWGPGAPPVKVPAIWDDVPQGESWDASRCFEVMYIP